MKVNIFNHQKALHVDEKILKKQVTAVLKNEKISTDEVNIYLVNKKKICQLHKEFFNDPEPTDCISFPIDLNDESSHYKILGDIFVCSDVALEYAQENEINPINELTLYVIHALMHLIGYDDIAPKDKKIMRKKEKSCIDLLKSMNLYKE